jgi:hypothetical protein
MTGVLSTRVTFENSAAPPGAAQVLQIGCQADMHLAAL